MTTSDHASQPTGEVVHHEPNATCPECGGQIQTDASEVVCTDCGLVLKDQRIDTGPDWRGFDHRDNRERTGAPLTPTRHDRGLSTELWVTADAKGNSLSARKRRQLGRLKREHKRSRWRSKGERNLAHGLSETRRVASALDLPQSIRDQACALFRSAAKENLLPGRSIEAIAAASVYAACRCNGLPRTIEEVAAVAAVDSAAIDNGYTVLNRKLGIPAVPPSPTDFIPRIASAVGISDGTRRLAEEFAEQAAEGGIGNGCHPGGLAAGCVYAAARSRCEGATQTELAEVVGVSAVTVRARWEELRSINDGEVG